MFVDEEEVTKVNGQQIDVCEAKPKTKIGMKFNSLHKLFRFTGAFLEFPVFDDFAH